MEWEADPLKAKIRQGLFKGLGSGMVNGLKSTAHWQTVVLSVIIGLMKRAQQKWLQRNTSL